MLRDITCDSENFIPIFGWKQKLQLSKVKSAIIQLNTRYYRNCYTKKQVKTQFDSDCQENLLTYFREEYDYHVCSKCTNILQQS